MKARGTRGDAERHAGEADAVEREHRDVVERPALAPVGRGVAPGAYTARHEQVGDLVVVAGGAAQPDDVPGVLDVRLLPAEQHGAVDRPAGGIEARLAVALEDTVECPPIQVALALPLANRHLPVTR